jgi:cytochrome c2
MRVFGFAVLIAFWSMASFALAADAEAGKRIFQTVCHQCHAALPYTGRIGLENLPKFLATPRRFKPTTAMTFPGLRSQKDIDNVIAYVTENQ